MKYLNAISRTLAVITEKFISVLFFLMLVLVLLQVLFRYFLHLPLAWTEELARYLMTWLIFLGASIASFNRDHLNIGLLQDTIPETFKKLLLVLLDIIVLIFLFVVVIKSIDLIQQVKGTKSPVLQISMALPYLSVALGGVLMIVHTSINIVRDLCRLGKKERE